MPHTHPGSVLDRAVRGAAVIVASRPLHDPDAKEGESGEDRGVLPALLKAGQMSFIEHVIARFQQVGAAPIIVVTGFENDALERHLAKMSVVSLHQPDWKSSSFFEDALFGLSYAERTCGACEKFWLATPQIPFIETDTISALLVSDQPLALPVFEDREGLPLVFHRSIIPSLTDAAAGRTLSDLVCAAGPPDRIPVSDSAVLPGAKSPDLEAGHGRQVPRLPMRPRVKLTLARDGFFFGPGPATLLRLIDETRSVRTACTRMKLSYSKGWQLLNGMEEELGIQVIERRPGGPEGGSSTLTEAGRDLLNRYEQLVSESQKQVNELYDDIFASFP